MGEVWSNCRGLAELPRFGRIAEVWLNCRGLAELPRPGRSRAGHVSGGRRCFSGRDCTESAFCGTPAANAASILAERGISPSRDCMKSAFYSIPVANAASCHTGVYSVSRRGEVFSQPRLHKTSVLRHSSCKRGKHSGGKGHFSQPRLHKIGVLRHSSCKRGKHSGQKGRFSGRDCTKSAFYGTPAANAASIPAKRGVPSAAIAQNRRSAALQLQTRQAFRPKGAFFRPRLHENSFLRHSSCKRGRAFRPKGAFSGRDYMKSAFYGTPAANAASIPAKRGISSAAIAQNRPSTALQLQTRQGIPAKRGVSSAAIAQNRPPTALQLQTWQTFTPEHTA